MYVTAVAVGQSKRLCSGVRAFTWLYLGSLPLLLSGYGGNLGSTPLIWRCRCPATCTVPGSLLLHQSKIKTGYPTYRLPAQGMDLSMPRAATRAVLAFEVPLPCLFGLSGCCLKTRFLYARPLPPIPIPGIYNFLTLNARYLGVYLFATARRYRPTIFTCLYGLNQA